MADFNTVATQFVEYYYSTFDANRQNLGPLYRDNSMMTFETNQVAGVANIVNKLVELPFQKVIHKVSTLDAQPAGDAGQILVHVTGQLLIDDSEHPQTYSQTFQLVPAEGTYYVLNDIMRLSFGG